jgi:hypothetical protein
MQFQFRSPHFFTAGDAIRRDTSAPIKVDFRSPARALPVSGEFVLLPVKIAENHKQKGRKVYRPAGAGSMEPGTNGYF